MHSNLRFGRPSRENSRGQSLIESCIAIALICVVFIGALQVSQLYVVREMLSRAAMAGVRARTVGLNDFMVHKVVKIATIPIAGSIVVPGDTENQGVTDALGYTAETRVGDIWTSVLSADMPPSAVFEVEEARISSFLSAYNWSRAELELDYADWDTIEADAPESDSLTITMTVTQGYTNWLALPRTYFASDRLDLEAEYEMENHYSLYMDDTYAGGW